MDEPRLRSFLLARGLLGRGQTSVDGTAPGSMAAIVLYDMAVETGAKAAAAVHCPEALRQRDLSALLGKLAATAQEAAGGAAVSAGEIRGARELHKLRNLVQHDSHVPSPESVERGHERALALLAWLTENFFGVGFERISRASLIHNETVRSNIERAERYAGEQDLEQAAVAVAIALEFARIEFRTGQLTRRERLKPSDVGSAVREIRRGDEADRLGRGYEHLDRLLRALAGNVELLVDRVEALSLGARAPEYEWFLRHFPRVERAMRAGGTFDLFTLPTERAITPEIYDRGHDFVVTTALHWQQFPAPPEVEEDS